MPIVDTHISNTKLFEDLKAMDRDNFSYDGARALMEYLEQLSEDMGEIIEYDPIAFCCGFTEYSDDEILSHFQQEHDDCPHPGDLNAYDNDEEYRAAVVDWLKDRTDVAEFNGGIVIRDL